MVRREWRAELPSHHEKKPSYGSQDKGTPRYWQYYVGQTIHAHLLHACKWARVPKLAQVTKLKLAVDDKEGMAS